MKQSLVIVEKVSNLMLALAEMKEDEVFNDFEYYAVLKQINTITTDLTEAAQPAAYSFLSAKSKFELAELGVEIRQGAKQWDFSAVTYAPYLKAKEVAEKAKDALSLVEKSLKQMAEANAKLMPSGAEAFGGAGEKPSVADPASGEVIDLPIIKSYNRGSITFKKA